MLLHTVDTGRGDKTALLLHGLMGSAESWWRVIPLLIDHGYRVLAMDLPGHGESPRDPHLTVAAAAASVVETLAHHRPEGPLHAIGHSYGATVLAAAAAAAALAADVTVYVDSALAFPGGADRATLEADYSRDRRDRMNPVWLRATRPHYSQHDAEVEARAAARFDPATSASISCGDDVEFAPAPGSILVHADPGTNMTDADKRRFTDAGASVRGIPGAAHTVWYSHFAEFTASVPEMFAKYP